VRTRVDSRGLASWRKRPQFQALRARNRVMSLCCKLRLKGVRLPPPPLRSPERSGLFLLAAGAAIGGVIELARKNAGRPRGGDEKRSPPVASCSRPRSTQLSSLRRRRRQGYQGSPTPGPATPSSMLTRRGNGPGSTGSSDGHVEPSGTSRGMLARMRNIARYAVGALLGLALGWYGSRTWETPREYFRRASPTGAFGMFKNTLDDHVATFHGFDEDRPMCEQAAATLNAQAGSKMFFCAALQD